MKNKISRISALIMIFCGAGCTRASQADFSKIALEGKYIVKEVALATKDITKPAKGTSLVLEKGGKCLLTDWPLDSMAIISPSGNRVTGLGHLQGEWQLKNNGGKYEIQLQVRQSPAKTQNILILTLVDSNPTQLRCYLDVGSEDDFMLLEYTTPLSETAD